MANLLITGALGHIGSRFIHETPPAIVEQITLLDNLSTQRYGSLFSLPRGAAFEFFEDDICTADLDKYFLNADIVLHLAAITNAEGSFGLRDEVERTNFEGTRRVAEACARCNCKLIFLSTTSVYGPQNETVDENCAAEELQPQSPYAESKLRAERLLQELGAQEGLKYVICRFGTIFGSSQGMRFHTAVNKFVWQACLGQPVTVWRTAMFQNRPYLELGDAIRALYFIIEKDLFENRVYNILTTNTTVNEITEIIRSYMPGLRIEYVDSPIMNQMSYTVSNHKFRNLGFQFKGSLWRGIGETVDLFSGLNGLRRAYPLVQPPALLSLAEP